MQKLTLAEFQDRLNALNRAKRIFSHMTDNDITQAFIAYQEVLSETDRPFTIRAQTISDFKETALDTVIKPSCPICGNMMNFRIVPKNDEGINSQLVCTNPNCDTVLDSEKPITEWYEILPKKDLEIK